MVHWAFDVEDAISTTSTMCKARGARTLRIVECFIVVFGESE